MAKIAIIGAGPAGIFCALKLIEFIKNADITIFDKNKPLLTLLPTGNGRCNLSHDEPDNKEFAKFYPRGEKFLYSVFARYNFENTVSDFKKLGINTYTQKDKRIFPESNSAYDVRIKLLNSIKNKVKFIKKEITHPLEGFDYTVLAVGLKSGGEPAKKYGLKMTELRPALSGLKIKEKEFTALEGVSFGGVIFTKCGVSGPYIYKLSSYNAYKDFPYEIKIPLVEIEKLKEEMKNNPKKLFKNVVSNFIPKSLANLLIKNDKQCANVSNKEINELEFLHLTATGRDNKGEIVHAGGVCLKELDKNFKVKDKNLWVIGELTDIDGLTGGFNLQLCWSSAYIAAKDIADKINSDDI